MKFLHLSTLLTASLLILNGCNGTTPKPDKAVKLDTTLPIIHLTKRGVITDMHSVAFEWESIKNDPRVAGVYIYKRTPGDENQHQLQYYDTIANRYATHYVDNNVEPNTQYSYAFKVYSKDAEAKQSKSFKIKTLPVLDSVAWIHSFSGMPQSAKIIWRPHINPRVASYIVERRELDDKEFEQIAQLDGRLHAEYIDEDLDNDKVYEYRIKVKTYDGIVSTPSKVVKVITKPLPKSLTHVYATKNLPKKIKISWEDTTQKDFYRYYLYRSDTADGSYELIAKLFNNHFIDKVDSDGAEYFYRVSVVDKDGLESDNTQTTTMGMSLVPPKAPTFLEVNYSKNAVIIGWKNNDPRAHSYIVEKRYKESWLSEKIRKYTNIRTQTYIDRDIRPDTTYTYRVYSVDANNIVSKPSEEAVITTPESLNVEVAPVSQTQEKVAPQPQVQQETHEVVQPVDPIDLNEI